MYSNIYLFGINSDASSDSKKVFEEIIKNLRFNVNLTDYKNCGTSVNNLDEKKTCVTDLDCSGGEFCYAQISKFKRNYQRLERLGGIYQLLEKSGGYPSLSSGSLLIGQSVSTWPSWQSALGNQLNSNMVLDPTNKLGKSGTCKTNQAGFCLTDGDCGTGGKCVIHDATTGWSTEDLRLSFACNTSSLAFRYIINASSTNYEVRAKMENPFGNDILDSKQITNWFIILYNYVDTSKFTLGSADGICTAKNEIISANKQNYCGDGIKSISEDCEKGDTKTEDNCLSTGWQTISSCDITTCKWVPVKSRCEQDKKLCGIGGLDFGEFCDEGSKNGGWNACNKKCTAIVAGYVNGKAVKEYDWNGFSYSSPGICGDTYINSTYEFCDPHDKKSNDWRVYNITKDKSKTCSYDCQDYGGYCGDGIIQNDVPANCDSLCKSLYYGPKEVCEKDVSCTMTDGRAGKYICGTATCQWKGEIFDSNHLPPCTTTVAVAGKVVVTGCGDGKLDAGEVCDWGSDPTKPQYNNATCTPKYGETCPYCDNTCKTVYVQPAQWCGDGIVQSPDEVCDKDSSGNIYVASTSTTGAGGLASQSIINGHGGYKLATCGAEAISSLEWLKGNAREGTKDCSATCQSVINHCIECGVDKNNAVGSTINGQIVNVIMPSSTNPLMVNYISSSAVKGYSGVIDLFLRKYAVTAKHFFSAISMDPSKSAQDLTKYSIRLKQGNSASSTVALINNDSNCSFGVSPNYVPNYSLSINAGWGYGFDFDVLSSEAIKKDPWRYDLLLSPIMLKKVRSELYALKDSAAIDQQTGAVKIKARPKDVRIVVSWVNSNLNFQSGFLIPVTNTAGKLTTLEGVSNLSNVIAVGLDYYNKNYIIWYHGYKSTDKGLSMESYTVDTNNIVGNTYSFYVRIPSGSIKSYQSSAVLKADIYLPEDYIESNWKECCSDILCKTLLPAVNRGQACWHDYRLFSKPYKTIYFTIATPSANEATAQYWHILNLKKVSNSVLPVNSIEVINAISTGPEYFKY